MSIMCTEVVGLPEVSRIEKVFDQVFELIQFNIDREMLQKKVRLCLIRYINKIFEIFPPMLTNQLLLVDKQGWMDELKVNIDIRFKTIINEDQTNFWFARTTE